MSIKEFGPLNDKKRERIHQGWWRTYVLNECAGKHPRKKDEHICNTLPGGTKKNFISEEIFNLISDRLKQRNINKITSGMIDETRLYDNLLASQPLCVNFFGLLVTSEENILNLFLSKILEKDIRESHVFFEYDGNTALMKDKSAFDVAIEYKYHDNKGLLGLECKYTDSFSYKPSNSKAYYGEEGNKNYASYQEIYHKNQESFLGKYDEFVRDTNSNQLFRNELIACCLRKDNEKEKYHEVYTGLFCSEHDENALKAGGEFRSKITNEFHIITYKDYFENLQSLDIDYETRKLSMLLWARYCGFPLSENIYNELKWR